MPRGDLPWSPAPAPRGKLAQKQDPDSKEGQESLFPIHTHITPVMSQDGGTGLKRLSSRWQVQDMGVLSGSNLHGLSTDSPPGGGQGALAPLPAAPSAHPPSRAASGELSPHMSWFLQAPREARSRFILRPPSKAETLRRSFRRPSGPPRHLGMSLGGRAMPVGGLCSIPPGLTF